MMVEEIHQGKGKMFSQSSRIEKRSTTPSTTQTPKLSTYDNVSNRETSLIRLTERVIVKILFYQRGMRCLMTSNYMIK